MSDGPAAAPGASPLLALIPGLVADNADIKARMAQVERSVPELASRLDGRFGAVEGQIARTQDHLAQQDQQQAAFRLDMKSTLGTLASGLGTLQQAEQQRAQDAREAAQRAQEAQQRAQDQAQENRAETRRWALQTVASVGLMLPGVVWPLMVTHPPLVRLGVPAACMTLVLLLAALAWLRSRH